MLDAALIRRRSVLTVVVVAALGIVVALAGSASASAALSGTVEDPKDLPPEVLADGTPRPAPDLKHLDVWYDPAGGTLSGSFEFWQPLGVDEGPLQAAYLNFTAGSRFDNTATCVADTTGDVSVEFELMREQGELVILGMHATFEGYVDEPPGGLGYGIVTTTDWRTFTFAATSTTAPLLPDRAYKCVKNITLGEDRADDFCLGQCPAPPVVDNPVAPSPPPAPQLLTPAPPASAPVGLVLPTSSLTNMVTVKQARSAVRLKLAAKYRSFTL